MERKSFFTNPIGVVIASLVTTFLWGSATPVIKLGYENLHIQSNDIGKQILFAGYRFFIASVFVFLFFHLLKNPMKLRKKDVKPLVTIGMLQTFLQYFLFYIGVSNSTGIQSSIIAGTTSFFQIILAHFMYKDDKISFRKVVGLIIGFLGVMVVNMNGSSLRFTIGIGELLLFGAIIISAYSNLLVKNKSTELEIGYITAYQMLIGSTGLIIVGSIKTGMFPFYFDLVSFSMFLYLAFVSAAGFVIWNNVMKYNKVGNVSMFLMFIPIFGVALSSTLLQEPLHWQIYIGLICVIGGIVIVNMTWKKKKREVLAKVS